MPSFFFIKKTILQEFSKSDRIYVNVNVYIRIGINFEMGM